METKIIQITDEIQSFEINVEARAEKRVVFHIVAQKHIDGVLTIHLLGEGATVEIFGLIETGHHDDIHMNVAVMHEAKHTKSVSHIKCVVKDESTCTVDGLIHIEKQSDASDAYQKIEVVLIGNEAKGNARPMLEILNKEVKCSHGTTVAHIPEDIVWSMQSAGLSKPLAEQLYIKGFTKSINKYLARPAKGVGI